MTTISNLTELKISLTQKGMRFIETKSGSVGVFLTKHVIHWFDEYSSDTLEFISFEQTYSMNTGRTKRGIMHQIKVQHFIEKKLGIKFGQKEKQSINA